MLDDVYIINQYYENYKGITYPYDNGIQEARQNSQCDDKSYTSDITNIIKFPITLSLCTLEEYMMRYSRFVSEDNEIQRDNTQVDDGHIVISAVGVSVQLMKHCRK